MGSTGPTGDNLRCPRFPGGLHYALERVKVTPYNRSILRTQLPWACSSQRKKNLIHALDLAVDDLCGPARVKVEEQLRRAQTSKLTIDLDSLEHAHNTPGWEGLKDREPNPFRISGVSPGRRVAGVDEEVQDLLNWHQYRLIKHEDDVAQLLLDRKGRIVFVKCRPPETVRCQGKDLKWTEVIKGVEEAIDALAQVVGDQEKYRQKSRGNFPAVNFGYTMGPGDTEPHELREETAKVKEAIKVFRSDHLVHAYVLNLAELLRIWHPHVAHLYSMTLLATVLKTEAISMLFPGLQFASCTVNLGKASITDWHLDLKNLAFGVCALGIFGQFNYRRGGHLILKRAKVVVELARGDVVFFLSAIFPHKNAGIGVDKTRRALVFYSQGSLFRWIADVDGNNKEAGESGEVWCQGLSLLNTWEVMKSVANSSTSVSVI